MEIRWLTAFIDMPEHLFDVGATFWEGVTGSRRTQMRGEHEEFATLVPPDGDPYLRVQRIAAGEPRVHLDLHVASKTAALARAREHGASLVADLGWLIMRSPGGFVFCLVDDEGESIRPGSHPSPPHRLDQFSVDIPFAMFDSESRFWAALTGWDLQRSALDEFARLEVPRHLPYRILLQRLGEDDGGGEVRAHLDIACGDNIDEVATHHESIGATNLGRCKYWVTMQDPIGLRYCLTPRDPETGTVPKSG